MSKSLLFVLFSALVLANCAPTEVLTPTRMAGPSASADLQAETPSALPASPVSTLEPRDSPTQMAETDLPLLTDTPHVLMTDTLAPATTQPVTLTPALTPAAGAIIVDHTSVDLFNAIPDRFLEAARNTAMVFVDRSVGANIDQALDCLAAPSWSQTPAHCRRAYYDDNWNWKTFSQQEFTSGQVPSTIFFEPDAEKYNRSNWTFQFQSAEWEGVVRDFVEVQVPSYVGQKDVLSYQFNYFHIDHGSSIDGEMRQDGVYQPGFFDSDPGNPNRWDISDLEALETQYPDKVFIYWTTSLARNVGSIDGQNFNAQMRAYAAANGKVLFDVADIESHDPSGNLCVDSRDGVCYCNTNECEDYSIFGQTCDWDDGQDIVAICQEYTTETLGGHLGSVSTGKIRIAKAFWVLMARIAGWDGVSQE